MVKLDSSGVKKALFEHGADLVGIGSIDRWTGIAEREHPSEIMPRVKSVMPC